MKFLLALFAVILFSCGSESTNSDPQLEALNDLINDLKAPVCPKEKHTDSIVPIEYGYPSEEMFLAQDSGKIVLGGCEIGEDNHYCLKHDISFH